LSLFPKVPLVITAHFLEKAFAFFTVSWPLQGVLLEQVEHPDTLIFDLLFDHLFELLERGAVPGVLGVVDYGLDGSRLGSLFGNQVFKADINCVSLVFREVTWEVLDPRLLTPDPLL